MRWTAAAALAAGVLAGCGVGTSSSPPTRSVHATTTARPVPTIPTTPTTVTTATTTTPTTTTPVAPTGGCSLTDPTFKTGAPLDCVRKGADVHLVHKHDILATSSVIARLLPVNQTTEINGKTRSFTAKGTFVRVTLAITNPTSKRRAIRPGQTALLIGNRQFDEVVALEDGEDGKSLLDRGGPKHPLAPGASVTGEAVYDVPIGLATRIPTDVWVAIAGFGSSRNIDHRRLVGGIALGR
jgi:hypothetical protein